MSFRGALCSLLTVIAMFLFAEALAIFRTKSGVDLRSALTDTMSDPFFWVATIAWAALAYQLAR